MKYTKGVLNKASNGEIPNKLPLKINGIYFLEFQKLAFLNSLMRPIR